MTSPRFRGVLLCEDKEHARFFLQLLRKWFGRGKVYVDKIPNRDGAGDAYVLAQYARAVRYARSRRGENYALVVAVDGDRVKLNQRLRQLDRRLEDAGLPRRGEDDRIVIFVPTRSIETWEYWLCGNREINEETNCKQRFRGVMQRGELKKAVESWFRPLSDEERQLEEETLPALVAGRLEVRRLDK